MITASPASGLKKERNGWAFLIGAAVSWLPLPHPSITLTDMRRRHLFTVVCQQRLPDARALALEQAETLREGGALALPEGVLAQPETLTFATEDGETAHGYFYAPKNASVTAPDVPPPLLVISHGGPTASTSPALNLKVQFWTSRGFAVLDVNYRGSTGYGRAYRDALRGAWGARDVSDCVDGAKALILAGRVDPERCAIRGSSAGGLTVLGALAFPTPSGGHQPLRRYGSGSAGHGHPQVRGALP